MTSPQTPAISRQTALDEAQKWLGTPYHHQARVRGIGVDCAMLLCEVYEAIGLVPHIDPTPYPPDWHFHRSEERYLGWVEKYGRKVDSPKPGDVALFKFGRCMSHGAIVVEWPAIIHAYYREGCTTADASLGLLADREVAFYTLFEEGA